MAPPSKASQVAKKRKTPTETETTNGASKKKATNGEEAKAKRAALHKEIDYEALTLKDIHDRIESLCLKVPTVPESDFAVVAAAADSAAPKVAQSEPKDEDNDGKAGLVILKERLPKAKYSCPYDKLALREWATGLQTVLEEFNLLVACVSPSTYVWGTNRSGAADQHLSLLSQELVRSQEQIMARVAPRLNDVLAPVVTLLTDKTVTVKNERGEEIKQNYFCTTHEDPDYLNLCHIILARNAKLLRQVVLANFDKLLQAIQDYLAACQKDSQHDSRGFVY